MAPIEFSWLSVTLIVGAIIFIYILLKSITIVPEGHVVLLEKYGKRHAILEPGYYWYCCVVYDTKHISWKYLPPSPQGHSSMKYSIPKGNCRIDPPPVKLVTKDNIETTIDIIASFTVKDPYKAVYESCDVTVELGSVLLTTLRDACASLTFDELNTNSTTANNLMKHMRSKLDDFEHKFGVDVTQIGIERIEASQVFKKKWEEIAAAKKTAELELITNETKRKRELQDKQNSIHLEEMQANHKSKMTMIQQETDANNIKAKATAELYKREKEIEAKERELKSEYDAKSYGREVTAKAEAQYIRDLADAEHYKLQKMAEAESNRVKWLTENGKFSEQYFVQQLYADAWKSLANSNGKHMIVPYDSTKFLGMNPHFLSTYVNQKE